MTREEFIKKLESKGYSYREEGNKIIVDEDNGYVNLISLKIIPGEIEFSNKGNLFLGDLESISPNVLFSNQGNVLLKLTSIPKGVEFNNRKDVYLPLFGWFDEWVGNIEGIGYQRLLNKMISLGLFNKEKK